MNRNLETTDVIVAVGMIATLFGGYFLYVASYGGVLGVQPSVTKANSMTTAAVERQLQQSIQAAMDKQSALSQKFEQDVARAAGNLQKAMKVASQPTVHSVEGAVAKARAYKATYDGNVQYMLGKTIVNLTRQGMQSGALTAENLTNRHNDRIIATAMRKANRAEQAFTRHGQTRMGNWIVAAARNDHFRTGAMQHRLGKATVQLAMTKHEFSTQQMELQNQHRALLAAAVRTGAQSERFTQLARAETPKLVEQPMANAAIVEAGLLPEISTEVMVVAFLGLITIFMIGLSFPTGHKPGEHDERPSHPVMRLPRRPTRKAS